MPLQAVSNAGPSEAYSRTKSYTLGFWMIGEIDSRAYGCKRHPDFVGDAEGEACLFIELNISKS